MRKLSIAALALSLISTAPAFADDQATPDVTDVGAGTETEVITRIFAHPGANHGIVHFKGQTPGEEISVGQVGAPWRKDPESSPVPQECRVFLEYYIRHIEGGSSNQRVDYLTACQKVGEPVRLFQRAVGNDYTRPAHASDYWESPEIPFKS